MKFSRRNFIKTGGLTAVGLVGLAISPEQIFGANASGAFQTDALYSQNEASFRELIGTKFTIYSDNFAADAQLETVKNFSVQPSKKTNRRTAFGKSRAECFSLAFILTTENLQQDVYKVFHPAIGHFDLLLVPSVSEKGAPALTAVINRI